MKRYLFLILLIFIVALTACNDNDNNKTNGSDSGHFVEFTTEMLNIYTYQLEKLPINTNADMESFTITSSDDAVAKVENLMIMPYSAGSVTITATLSNGKTDSLVVNVEEDGNVPYLEVSDLSIKLFENSSYVLDTYVKLRGKKVEATYTFKSSDSSIATIDENGKIVALKSGAVDINVIANYNGYTGNELYSLSRTVTLEVIPSVILSISSEKTAINNRTDIINNVNYSNETSLSGTIYVDGEYKDILNSNVEWVSSNSSVAKVVDNKIVGYAVGEVEIYAQITIDNAIYTSNYLTITIEKPLVVVDNYPVDIDLTIGEVSLSTEYMLSGDSTILAIYDQENPNGGIIENGKLVDYDELGERNWIVESTSNRYLINVIACSKIITNKDELGSLHSYGKNIVTGTSGIISFEGYFILANDIDMKSTRFRTFCGISTGATSVIYNGFVGVFDGRGHTISNAAVAASNGGLFGTMNKDSVVKNVAFVNANVSGDSGLISSNFGGVIENVYVEGKLTCTRATSATPTSLLASKIYDGAKITNCIIKLTNPTVNNSYSSAIGMLITAKEDALNNVYVLGTKVKVLSTSAADIYNTLANQNNGQFENYSELLTKDLSSFNNYWIFGDTGISFSSSH